MSECEKFHRVTFHLTERQLSRLRALAERTGTPLAVMIRWGVDMVLRVLEKGGRTG